MQETAAAVAQDRTAMRDDALSPNRRGTVKFWSLDT